MAFLYRSMIHFQTHWKHLLPMCISEFYLRANVTKYIETQMSLFYVFCTPVNSWNESSYCDSDMHISSETFLHENRYIGYKQRSYNALVQ